MPSNIGSDFWDRFPPFRTDRVLRIIDGRFPSLGLHTTLNRGAAGESAIFQSSISMPKNRTERLAIPIEPVDRCAMLLANLRGDPNDRPGVQP